MNAINLDVLQQVELQLEGCIEKYKSIGYTLVSSDSTEKSITILFKNDIHEVTLCYKDEHLNIVRSADDNVQTLERIDRDTLYCLNNRNKVESSGIKRKRVRAYQDTKNEISIIGVILTIFGIAIVAILLYLIYYHSDLVLLGAISIGILALAGGMEKLATKDMDEEQKKIYDAVFWANFFSGKDR
jgi:hypothetical protein